ncbi:MAG: hypothetical protein AAB443_01845 [Patescibacteria group bacterium]
MVFFQFFQDLGTGFWEFSSGPIGVFLIGIGSLVPTCWLVWTAAVKDPSNSKHSYGALFVILILFWIILSFVILMGLWLLSFALQYLPFIAPVLLLFAVIAWWFNRKHREMPTEDE